MATRTLAQQPVGFGKELSEVETIGARLLRGGEVGAMPLAGGGIHLGVESAGLAAIAVLLVIGQVARQIPECGTRSGGSGAAAVAIGAEGRAGGQAGIAKLLDLGAFHRLLKTRRGLRVLADLVGV